MSPAEIKNIRTGLGLTQKEISLMLRLGAKTWTRWETGKEKPFTSMRVLIQALRDRKITVSYLRSLDLDWRSS